MIAAQQFFVEHGDVDLKMERLKQVLPTYIPDFSVQGEQKMDYWLRKVAATYRRAYFLREKSAAQRVREDIVKFAKFKWPLLFSRFYEATKFSGPSLPKNDVIIAVNWTGVYVVDNEEHVLMELSFPEITAVSASR